MEKAGNLAFARLPRFGGWHLFLVGVACCLAGCRGETGPAKHKVTGTVKLDGKPLSNGDLIFYPEAANLPADAGKVQNGRYTFRVVAGRHRVVIQAVSDKPIITSPVDPPVYESIVPSRYNDATTLRAEVTAAGPNRFDFELTSDKPAAKGGDAEATGSRPGL